MCVSVSVTVEQIPELIINSGMIASKHEYVFSANLSPGGLLACQRVDAVMQ